MHYQNTRLTQSTFRTGCNFFASVLAVVFFGCASDVFAAVKSWDGSSGANWSTAANWTPSGAPVDGDDLIFPAGAFNLINTNNLTDLRLGSITFNGASAAYSLRGNAITISNGVIAAHTAGDNDLNFTAITNAASQTYTVDSGGTLDVNANVVLIGGFTLTVNNDFTTRFDGAISGTGNLSKSSGGTGTLAFGGTAANTYAGATTVNGSILQLSKTAGVISVPGDLTIGASDTVLLLTDNQIANTSDVTISSSGLLDLNGNVDTIGTVTMTGAMIDTGVGGDIATGNITVNASATASTISGTYTLVGTRTITVIDGTANPDLLVSAVIEGAGGVTVNNLSGGARVDFSGANTYSGLTTLSNGFLYVNNPSGLGASAGGTVLAGGNLTISGVTISGEGLTIIATSVLQGTGASGWTGPIVLNANLFLLSPGTLDLSGAISGTGGVTKASSATGTVRYSGASANTYTGTTTVEAGTLELDKPAGIDAILGDLVIGDGSGTDTVRTFGSNLIDNSSDLTMNEGSVLDLQTFIEAVGRATMTGATVVGTGNTFNPQGSLTVNASSVSSTINKDLAVTVPTTINVANGSASTDLLINGVIFGAGDFTKTGAGQLRLTGVNTYSGPTVVAAGLLTINDGAGLGSTAAGTVISNGASLAIGVAVGTEALTLNGPGSAAYGFGALYSFSGPNSWTGPITLASDSVIEVNGSTFDLSGVISGPGDFTKVGGGTLIFSGAAGNNYTGNTFVQEGTLELGKVLAIQSSASLVIGDGIGGAIADVVRYTANNCINTSVPISIDETGLLDLNGFSDTVGALTLLGGDITTGAGTLTMNNNLTATYRGVGDTARILGNLALGASTRTFTVTNTPGLGAADLFVLAAVSGTGGIIKTGDGLMVLSASNSFSGAVTVNDGDLDLQDDFSAGTTSGGVTVNGDATLRLFGNIHIGAEALTLNSTATSGTLNSRIVSNSWAGPVTLSANTIVTVSAGDALNLLGPISGPGGLTKIGSGTLYYSGGTANTYVGVTTVNQGTLVLAKSFVNGAMINNLVIGDGSGGVNADVVRLDDTSQLPTTVAVTVNSSGVFDLNSINEFFGSLSGSGNVILGTALIQPGNDDGSTSFSGVMSGTGSFEKAGAGTMTLAGNNTYTGSTMVTAGKLLVNGSQPQSHVTVGAIGILGGSGTVGNINNSTGGVVSPGTSPGLLTCSNVVFSGVSSDFTVELNGPGAGIGYDQLNVRGTNTIGGSTLNVTASFGLLNAPAIGDQFVLLNNDGAEAITGTFAGLANGASLTVDSLTYRLYYNGGTGNDIVLTVTNVPAADAGLTTVFSGYGNGLVDPNECNLINIVISNKTGVAMTGISAALQSYTPNVAVLQSGNSYPDIPANGRRTNTTPFQISTTPNFACGTTIQLQLAVQTATHNSFKIPVTLFTGSPGAVQSFDNNAVAAIPDGGTLNSTVNVSGFPGPVGQVTVTLHLTHPQDQDLDITLEAPDGTIVELTTDNGTTSANYGSSCAARTTFDDSAATAITAGVVPFVGTFRPEGKLSDFRGKSPVEVTGTWTLHVTDDNFNGFSGNLQCWTLNLAEAACVPGSGACETCPDVTLSGAVGDGSLVLSNRLTRTGVTLSSCDFAASCPGPYLGGGPPWGHYDAYTFQNGPTDACITVTLHSATADVFSAAYLGTFNSADTCQNYLADSGNSTESGFAPVIYSFKVAANAVFVVEVNSIFGSTGPYTLQVAGGDCRPALNITALPGNNVLLDWTTAAVGYGLESTNTLVPGGSSLWPPVNTVPVVINSRFNVTNNVTSSNQFYHLRKPLP